MINGFQITVDKHLCELRFVRWRKTHRQKRIRLKWQKKYGAITACASETAYRMGSRLICCPHMAEKIRLTIPNAI